MFKMPAFCPDPEDCLDFLDRIEEGSPIDDLLAKWDATPSTSEPEVGEQALDALSAFGEHLVFMQGILPFLSRLSAAQQNYLLAAIFAGLDGAYLTLDNLILETRVRPLLLLEIGCRQEQRELPRVSSETWQRVFTQERALQIAYTRDFLAQIPESWDCLRRELERIFQSPQALPPIRQLASDYSGLHTEYDTILPTALLLEEMQR